MGFEPTESCPSAAFKAAALVHYAISPYGIIRGAHPKARRAERDTEPHHIPMCPPTTRVADHGSRATRVASSTALAILLADTARTLGPRGERRRRCPTRGTRDSFAAATRNVHTTISLTIHATSPISNRHLSTRTRRQSARHRRSPGVLRNATRPPRNTDPTTRRNTRNGLPRTEPVAPPI